MITKLFKKNTTTKYTLEEFMKLNILADLYKDNDSKLYSEISKLLIKDSMNIQKKDCDLIVKSFISTLNEKPDFVQRFTMDGVEYGFVPNLDNLSVGEYVDLDEYYKQGVNSAHKVMSILYRPVTKSLGDSYQIEEYKGTDKYCDKMMKSPYYVYLSAVVFFYHLGTALSNYFNTCTQLEKMRQLKTKVIV